MAGEIKTFNDEDWEVSYFDSDCQRALVFEKVIAWCKKYSLYNGESIFQSDDGQIESTTLMCDIVDDILKFDCKLEDEE